MILFAHRGASGYEVENTLSSIKRAINMGAKAFEIDVQLTLDEKVVVYHDYSLGRIFPGKEKIMDLNYSDLYKISEGEIPTLEEVMSLIPAGSLLNIEIKADISEKREIEDYVFKIMNKFPEINILISSFEHDMLKRVFMKNKDVKIGVLFDDFPIDLKEYIKKLNIEIYSINPGIRKINLENGKEIKKLGYKMYIYTVNTSEDYERALKLGADGIFTDYIDKF
ncbi:glycerophosphodiester phosphodiesterase [Cetobacterium sp. SF1]|uniref:glycerophosphodiester phosphodiesterase n=1 Tax=Cetobacterium sp. SF1 TaxID=3417654 RepID=UPI003CF19F20